MTNNIIIAVFILCIGQAALSQTTEKEKDLRGIVADSANGWKRGGVIGINFSQASFNNWAAGGENSLALNSLLSVFDNYRHGTSLWDNTLDLGYGFSQQGNKGLIKTDDKIDISSKYGRVASKTWNYAGLLNLKSQFTPGYKGPGNTIKISDFLSPAYVLLAIGMDYKPNEHVTAFIAPVTDKTTIVNNSTLADAGAFGVDKATYDTTGTLFSHGKKTRSEFGGYVKMVYQNTFFKDKSVSLLTKLDMFSNYLNNPLNIDVNWETIIGFKVNKYITATITTNLVYDDDIMIDYDANGDGIADTSGPRTQFKEVLAIGFNYKF